MQHQYAKIQAWNADMSLIHMGTVFFLNGADYTFNKTIFSASLIDSRWSNTQPEIMYYGENEAFKRINVMTEEAEILHTFPGYEYATLGPWEGNITADDRYAIITSYDNTKASIYDIENDEVIATKEFAGVGFDWISFTPSGSYVVVSNNETDHTELYDIDYLLPETAETSGTCGYSSYNPNIGGHISGRSFQIPGWALVSASTHICSNGFEGYNWRTELFQIKLDGSGTIRPYGHSRTSNTHYSNSTRGSISPDGKRIIFTSDWGTFGNIEDTSDYVVTFNFDSSVVDEYRQSFKVYPNPVNSLLHIEDSSSDIESLTIFNVLGNRLKTYNTIENSIIDVSEFKTGVYVVHIVDDRGRLVTRKFVKE